MKLILFSVAAVLGTVCVGCDEAKAHVEVAPNGAVFSPKAAVERVVEMRKAGKIQPAEPAVVSFAAGEYELSETFSIPKEATPLRLVGPKGAKAVFSGGRKLGKFTAGADGIWRVKVPDGFVFQQLFVNGKRATLAREPNKLYHYVSYPDSESIDPNTGKAAIMARNAFFTEPKYLEKLRGLPKNELDDVLIHLWWSWDTEWSSIRLLDLDKGYVVLNRKTVYDFFLWSKYQTRFTIENCRTALDAPGEWFLDKKASELLYIPREGESVDTAVAIAPAVATLVELDGIEDVVFDKMTFAYNANLLPQQGRAEIQSAYNADAAIILKNSKNIEIRNCRITHTGNYGVWFAEGTHDSALRHTLIDDIGAGGVRIGPHKRWSVKMPPDQVPSHITVDDNIITHGGKVYPAGTAIFITFMRDSVITHNEICDMYYSGVCCGYVWGYAETPNRNNEISWNHIRNLGKGVLSDMGFIYTLGDSRGTKIIGNWGHDIFSYGYTGSGGTGLYPDEGSRGIYYASNLVHHTKTAALSQHYGKENFFQNNIFALSTKPDSSVAGRWRVENHTSLICSNNVFVYSAGHKAWKGPGGGKDVPVKDLVFGSNLWWSKGGLKDGDFNGGSWKEWQEKGMDKGSIFADPKFADPENGDFTMAKDSPAAKIGFKMWDYTFAGVRKENAAWRKYAESIVPEKYDVSPEPPKNQGRKSFQTGFETEKPGTTPSGLFRMMGGNGKDWGWVMESTYAAKSGKQSLELRDAPNLRYGWCPHAFHSLRISGENFTLKYAIKCSSKFYYHNEWRENTNMAANGQYEIGPVVFIKDGKLYAKDGGDSVQFKSYKADEWGELKYYVHCPKDGNPSWDLEYVAPDGSIEKKTNLKFGTKFCKRPGWFGMLSMSNEKCSCFIDDFSYENLD